MAIKFLNSVNADSGVLYVDAANNKVGIGTASPETLLQVNGAVYSMIGMYSDHTYSSNRNWRIVTNSFGAGNWGGLAIKTSDTAGGTPNTTRFGIDYLGNVGIGTTSPNALLEISRGDSGQTTAVAGGDNLILSDSSNGGMSIFTPSTALGSIFFGDESDSDVGWIRYNHTNDYMLIGTGGGTRVTIKNNGLINLGAYGAGYLKSDASGNITVDSDTIEDTLDSVTDRGNTTTNNITVGNITSTSGVVTMGQNKIDGSSDNLKIMSDSESVSGSSTIEFSVDGSEKMRINHTGKVGIGTTSPQEELEVKSASFSTVAVNTDRNAAGENIGSFAFYGHNNAATPENLLYSRVMGSMTDVTDGSEDGDIYFQQIKDGSIGETFRVKSNGNVGIGTTAPGAKLHVYSSTDNTLGIFESGDNLATIRLSDNDTSGYWHTQNSGTQIGINSSYSAENLTIRSGGNVGIGTTSPSQTFTVEKNSGIFRINTSTSTYPRIEIGSTSGGTAAIFNRTTASQNIIFGESSDTGNYIFRGGNIGIDVASPSEKLHVSGDVRIEGDLTVNGSYTQVDTDVNTTEQWNVTNDGTGPAVTINQTGSQDIMDVQDDGTSVFYIEDGGNVGIGTTDPTSKLHVNIPGNTVAFRASRNGGTDGDLEISFGSALTAYNSKASGHRWLESGSEKMRLTGGKLGIGTSSPVAPLDVSSASNGNRIILRSTVAPASTPSMTIGTQYYYTGTTFTGGSQIVFEKDNATAGNYGHHLQFWTRANGSSAAEKMRITSDGKVGIGTTTPENKLHVYGGRIVIDNAANAQSAIQINSAGSEKIVIYRPTSTEDLRIYTPSAGDAFTLTQSGNVGIGTTSPGSKLTVSGDIFTTAKFVTDSNELLRIYQSSWTGNEDHLVLYNAWKSGTGDYLLLKSSGNQDGNNGAMIIADGNGGRTFFGRHSNEDAALDSSTSPLDETYAFIGSTATYFSSNVGIGTTSPSTKLHISGDVTGTNKVLIENTDDGTNSYAGLGFQSDFGHTYHPGILLNSSTNTAYGGVDSLNIWQYHSKPITLVTNNVVRAIVTGGGDVGIGTTAPTRKLHVNSGTTNHVATFESTDSTAYIMLKDSGAYSNVVSADGSLLLEADQGQNLANSSIRFSVDASEKMRLLSSGNLGIDRTNPLYKLHVYHPTTNVTAQFESGDNQAWISVRDSGYTTYGAMLGCDNANGESVILADNSATKRFSIDESGNIKFHSYGAGYLKTDANGVIGLDTVTSVVDGTGTASYIPKWSDSDTLTDSVIYESSGSIGIGTESPTGTLEISQNLSAAETIDYPLVLSLRDDANSINQLGGEGVGIKFRIAGNADSTPGNSLWGASIAAIRESATDADVDTSLAFFTSAGAITEQVRIDSSGNVGIGTNDPSHKLTVNTGTNDIYFDEDTNINQGTGSSDQPAIYADSVLRIRQRIELWDDNDGNNYLDIRNGSTQAIKLTPDGDSWITNNLGLGTTSPDLKLHIAHSDGNNGLLLEHTSQASGYQILQNIRETEGLIWQRWTNGAFSANFMTLNYSGSLGVGTTDPQKRVHIRHDGNAPTGLLIQNLLDNNGTGDGDAAAEVFLNAASNNGYFRVHGAPTDNAADHEIELGSTAGDAFFTFKPSGNERMRIHNDGTIQLNSYGAGFIKSDASGNLSVDTTAYTTAQTLDDVTDLGNTTTNSISVGEVTLSNAPASNNGTFVKVYSDNHKRMYTATLNFSFTAAGTYNFNLVFPNSGGYQYELTAVNSRNGLYRNFGTLKDSSYIYWESDEDFTHRAEGDLHMISSYTGGMYFSADTTYFLSDGVTDSVQTGTANWSYAIVRYSIYIPRYDGDVTGSWKLHLTTYGDTGSGSPQFVLA